MSLNRKSLGKMVSFVSSVLGLAGIFAGLTSIALFGGFSSGPTSPNHASGYVVPVQDHDRVFYVTPMQFDLMNWLRNGAVLCVVGAVAGKMVARMLTKDDHD
jgi:hypothetical protein